MDHFTYINGQLHAEDVALERIAKEVGTPFYCYSTATIARHYQVFAEGFKDIKATICFAVKANSNLAVLKTLANLGSGADCVSMGEIMRALKVGIKADKIVFSGVGKTRAELKYALEAGIMQFNVESEPELNALNEVAIELGSTAPIAFRVNPDIDAGSHDKISTGRKGDKFGIQWEKAHEMYEIASNMEGIDVQGVSIHIGSQLSDLNPFERAFEKVAGLVRSLKEAGHDIKRLDLGGGLGIPYNSEEIPHPAEYAKMTIAATKGLDCELVFEPGRLIVGNAGVLVTAAIYEKYTSDRKFLIVDAAMNDLIRPTLYDAHHEIVAVKEGDPAKRPVDIVGPICETGDIFAKRRLLPQVREGDLLAIRSAGAYGAVQSSGYNSRPIIPEVLVNGSEYAIVRRRETYAEMLGKDQIPEWL